MWVHGLDDAAADPSCGGKAAGLARLILAGLPVPEGFAVDHLAFRQAVGPLSLDDEGAIGHALAAAAARLEKVELPAELVFDVQEWADRLELVAVRSSATIEDGPAGAAAGVFSSRRAVAAAEVWTAIRAVWTSALTPLAASYVRRRGNDLAIGVIIQKHVAGTRVTVYTRPPEGTADEVLIQRDDQPIAREPRTSRDPLVELALRAEAAIGATGGADVELVVGPDKIWIVQARPIVKPAWIRSAEPPPMVTSPLVADGRRWTLDVAHNPDPLSTAQAGLVERVERAAIAPWSLRVCAGFLYAAPRGPVVAPTVATRAELEQRASTFEAEIIRVLGTDVPPLPIAIERYLAFYRIWASELQPLIAAARASLTPEQLVGARPSAVEATLLAAARGELDEAAVIARLGTLAPAWDVAVPTFGERPGLLRDAIARAAGTRPRTADPARTPGDELARAAADLAERDDAWFARAQWLVRAALLARAGELELPGDDVFWLPLDEVIAGPADRDDARRRAGANRAAAARAASWQMPVIVGGEPPSSGRALHGVGTGPRITGRVVRFASLASAVAVGAGDIVVTRAVTPALAVLVVGCAALVSETGHLLDHGAALARELGIPCVVGCTSAWSLLGDGMLVTVDGAAGVVELASI